MYKRPSQRVRPNLPKRCEPLKEGSFLHTLMNRGPTSVFKFEKRPVYQREMYFRLLERNNNMIGIPYVQPELPDPVPYKEPEKIHEPEIMFGDRIQVTLRVLKSGIIRVKVNPGIAMMYDKYYAKGLRPPIKEIIKVYKSHGFSQQFLDKVKKRYDANTAFAKKAGSIIEKIFDKKQVKRVKPIPVKAKERDDEVEEEEEEEDDIPGEEGAMDMEPEEDDEIVEDEENLSDEET